MIRSYIPTDRAACLDIFDSNCPKYFDPSERAFIEQWLNAQDAGQPTYPNSSADHFYVLEKNNKVIACGGFYLLNDEHAASIAWGMVHSDEHRQGYGKELFQFRVKELQKILPGAKITLDTSQQTFGFFEKMGLTVQAVTKDGYGAGLDRYDMA
ncbi:GNAT family N-acetyltransferase [Polluticoccus soli]|uniref:GNAT family N-acetyltransferase n=1 Tax=Polluticoccus soli TaxID=3034150 RepID=UPI0023E1CD07|nr:GNAT family N-acetyltransferase [Flavipsychrobacter sp. JY13-12]